MQYIKFIIQTGDIELREMLMAQLSEFGFEGFEENDDALLAYIQEQVYNEREVQGFLNEGNFLYSSEIIEEQNWNAQWEENFQPVIVDGFCTIRADFHDISVNTPLEIVITPKMSFGTGHHATTQLMMLMMKDMVLAHKTVLDFGTGTGILAILAEKLGAGHILAIDNDEWSFENAMENVKKNDCKNISLQLGSIGDCGKDTFDIILANINRHILLDTMSFLYNSLSSDGYLLMSGLLKDDEMIIVNKAAAAHFKLLLKSEKDNWIVLLFEKI